MSCIVLPSPYIKGQISIETAVAVRPFVGPYTEEQLTAEQLGQLLWAAHTAGDNIRRRKGPNGRTWLVLRACCADGVWRYHPREHCLTRHLGRDVREDLAGAARNRWFIAQSPCILAISTVPQNGLERCEKQSLRCLPMEVGRVVERVLIQAAALGLVGVPVNEFDVAWVSYALIISRQEEPLCLLPVGRPAQED